MNLTFLDSPYVWDGIFLLILLLCIAAAARRGAIRAVSGIAGTVLGVVAGEACQADLSARIEPMLQPVMLSLARRADLTQVTGLEQGSILSDLVSQSAGLSDKLSELYHSLMEKIAFSLSGYLAPIIAFLVIFFAVKLAFWIITQLFDLNISLFAKLNKFAGGVLGAISGVLIIFALCWAVMTFAPEETLGLLSRPCLMQSIIGGRLAPFFRLP